jgi:hypothetical protein
LERETTTFLTIESLERETTAFLTVESQLQQTTATAFLAVESQQTTAYNKQPRLTNNRVFYSQHHLY